MRQLIRQRSGEATPRLQPKGQKEAATAGADAIRSGDFLTSIEDGVSEADKSLVRAASSQEALSIDIGLLVADLKEVGLTAKSLILTCQLLVTESQSSRKVSYGAPEHQAPM